jgi:hypothetical protein
MQVNTRQAVDAYGFERRDPSRLEKAFDETIGVFLKPIRKRVEAAILARGFYRDL